MFSCKAPPPPLAIYPLNAQYGGQDIGSNSNPDAKLSNAPAAAGPYGKTDGSIQLRGQTNSVIEIPNGGSLDTRRSTSILIWVYHEEEDGPIVDYSAFKTVNLWLARERFFEARFYNRDKRQGIVKTQTSMEVPPNTWNHVAATYDYASGKARLWVNEQREDEADLGVFELATDSAVVLMGSLEGLPYYFKGRVACLQFYDKALTKEQLAIAKRACHPGNL